jgi:hypothetical protein
VSSWKTNPFEYEFSPDVTEAKHKLLMVQGKPVYFCKYRYWLNIHKAMDFPNKDIMRTNLEDRSNWSYYSHGCYVEGNIEEVEAVLEGTAQNATLYTTLNGHKLNKPGKAVSFNSCCVGGANCTFCNVQKEATSE